MLHIAENRGPSQAFFLFFLFIVLSRLSEVGSFARGGALIGKHTRTIHCGLSRGFAVYFVLLYFKLEFFLKKNIGFALSVSGLASGLFFFVFLCNLLFFITFLFNGFFPGIAR